MKQTYAAAHDSLLFDLDGTISDPLVGIGRSLNFALVHFGYPELDDRTVSACIGPPLDDAFRRVTGVESADRIAEFVAKYRERYGEIGYSESVLYPEIPVVLEKLHDAGVPMGVCTSKRQDFAEKILEMFGLRKYFQFVSGGDIGIAKWQQIEGLLADGAIGEGAVMIGDRAVDVTAAHANGISAAGVLWGHGSRDELTAERPRYLFDSPNDLLSLIG